MCTRTLPVSRTRTFRVQQQQRRAGRPRPKCPLRAVTAGSPTQICEGEALQRSALHCEHSVLSQRRRATMRKPAPGGIRASRARRNEKIEVGFVCARGFDNRAQVFTPRIHLFRVGILSRASGGAAAARGAMVARKFPKTSSQ